MTGARPRLRSFLQRQAREVRAGGLRMFAHKTRMLLEAAAAMLFVLAARALRPILHIRFGELPAAGFGTLAQVMEVYCCERDAGVHGRGIDLFYYTSPVANDQLLRMWQRAVHVSRFAQTAARVNNWVPGGAVHHMPWRRIQARDIHNRLAVTPPHLKFTPDEERQGQAALRQWGIGSGEPWVCFHARDRAYDAERPRYQNHYHDYRNSDIQAQLPAMEALAARGYHALRMGAKVGQPLRTHHPRVLDYATTARTDFLDIYLSAGCRFYLGDPDGLASVPAIFRRPVAFVNYIPLEYAWSWSPQDLFIPKKLWLRAERRFLTFAEILRSGVGRYLRTELYERQGIEVVANTPDEITALALEMDERLKGTWPASNADESLQQRFWALFRLSDRYAELHGAIRSRIGAQFLRQHAGLLEATTQPAALVVAGA